MQLSEGCVRSEGGVCGGECGGWGVCVREIGCSFIVECMCRGEESGCVSVGCVCVL